MKIVRRNRKYKIILFIAAAGVVFLVFQIFSLKMLMAPSTLDRNKLKSLIEKYGVELKESDISDKDLQLKEHESDEKNPEARLPRGVHPDDAKLYRPDFEGMFRCLHSMERIPFSSMNDDYCDCEDNSDEPGTSACPNSSFFCQFQARTMEPQSVPSSRVNDGICDCCDGSDEWLGREVPPEIKIKDKTKIYSVFHSPCEDLCVQLVKNQEEQALIWKVGSQLKEKYVAEAKANNMGNNRLYGPNGEFYKLSKVCYEFTSGAYKYDICPFKSVKQKGSYPRTSQNIGRHPHWKTQKTNGYVLVMGSGDSHLCPGEIFRETVIFFTCGVEDKVISLTENDRCKYKVKMATPAAC